MMHALHTHNFRRQSKIQKYHTINEPFSMLTGLLLPKTDPCWKLADFCAFLSKQNVIAKITSNIRNTPPTIPIIAVRPKSPRIPFFSLRGSGPEKYQEVLGKRAVFKTDIQFHSFHCTLFLQEKPSTIIYTK